MRRSDMRTGSIDQSFDAGLLGAVRAAEVRSRRLDPMADDCAAAVLATRRQHVDGALETVEDMLPAVHDDKKRLVVTISAVFANLGGNLSKGAQFAGHRRIR